MLECGAVVDRLVRTRVGPFRLDDAVPSADLELEGERAWKRVLPPASALAGWPTLTLDAVAARSFLHGQPVTADLARAPERTFVAVSDERSVLLGIGEVSVG